MLQQHTSQNLQHITNSQHLEEIPKRVVTQREIGLGGHAPGNLPQGAGDFQVFSGGREIDLVEEVEEVALGGQAGRAVAHGDRKQLLEVGPEGPVDGARRHKAHTLRSKELVFVSVEVVRMIGVEDGLAGGAVCGLQAFQCVGDPGVCDLFIKCENAAVDM